MLSSQQLVLCVACTLVIVYLLYNTLCRVEGDEGDEADGGVETFEPSSSSPPPPTTPTPEYDLQAALDFSDLTVSDQQHEEFREVQQNAKQIKSVDERFEAAKRKSEEHGMHPGTMPNKKRRQLVEALVRRPFCGRRTRSWRTEFSDNLRGDVIPKNLNNDMGIMRIGRSDPSIDLHPGALRQVSGIKGCWLSEELVPDTAFHGLEDEHV